MQNEARPLTLPMGSEEISRILPHRYPFLLVDRVIELVPEKHILAYKNITTNEPFFNGHFPGLPVMPGVLQIEAMAQAAGILAFFGGDFDPQRQIALLIGVDESRFRKAVVPGDRLELHVEQMSRKRGLIKARCEARVDGQVVSEAIILAVVRDR